ncbi:MAG TPA: glutamine--fructose-6-phosphate transaminase (isomerizing) [Spirochaetia bacterium]|nr:glutamine--fructose-6-phosphate transaminase (isomerizing) [Spirochaetia bacterium]
MCGIFGYTGSDANPHILIEGIKRLEYRGYDSWGVCVACDDQLSLLRRVGRIGAADSAEIELGGRGCRSGIAHTRWATHGAPTEINAHPHTDCTGRIAVIHNGIIENHSALRSTLQAQGHRFASETDTEVIPHLIEEFLKSEQDFSAAFLGAMKLLVGAYGIAALYAGEPGAIFVARHGSPIVLGLGKDRTLVASDPAPLVAHTREVIYLDDGEAAILHGDGFETKTLEGAPVSKSVQQIAFSLPDIERGGFPHFMLKEISEQPESIHNAYRGRIVRAEGTAKLGGVDEALLRSVKHCHIVACGTSWHAGLIGKYLLEGLARIPTQVTFGSEFRYAHPVLEPDTLVVAISQSGETVDTLAGVREAKLMGAETIGICNVVGSSIARECGKGIYIHAGPEIGVASTKAFTSQLVVLSLLAVHLGRMRGMSLRAGLLFLDALERLPQQAEELLTQKDRISDIAGRYAAFQDFLFIGRLFEYPTALEGALKLKEISYIHAEGVQAAEMKHGPIALIEPDVPTVVLAAQAEIRDKMMGNMNEIRARSGKIIAVAQEGDTEIAGLAEETIFLPRTLDPLVPILAVIPLQMFAYFVAVARGCDVDKPRNLAKSVTVE